MQLRPYQREAAEAVLEQWEAGVRSTLLVLPTGCGKTIVFSRIAEEAVRHGGRVLILAHRGELLEQAADKLKRLTGLGCAVEKAEETAEDTWYNVTVGSIQSMSGRRLDRIAPTDYTHIIVDEAHHTLAPTYLRVLGHFAGAKVLGVTATADRGDRQELGSFYQTLAYEMSLPRAVREGWLCPIQAQTIPLRLEVSHTGGGDYTASECAFALDPYLEEIASQMSNCARDRKTVVFLPLVATAKRFRDLCERAGLDAREVNGESDDRAETLRWFSQAGAGAVLCNAMLLTEGWDEPSADCICVLRPTKVRALYAQMVGRGTRLSPGKENLLLLDFLWMSSRHDLCRPAHLVCLNPDLQEEISEILAEQSQGTPVDLLAGAESAEGKATAEREAKLARELEAQKAKEARLVDPLLYAGLVGGQYGEPDYSDLQGLQPPTPDQRRRLADAGINSTKVGTSAQAEALLHTVAARRDAGLATAKQIRLLGAKGFRDVSQWSFEDARKMVFRLVANAWRVPHSVDPFSYRPEGLR